MKGNVKTYSTISQLVSEALMDAQESDNKREQLTRFALKYFDEINFSRGCDIKTVPLTMKPWKAIELPDDCVDWVTIGIQCGEDVKTFVNDPYAVALLHETDANGNKLPNQPCPDYYDIADWPIDHTGLIPFYNLSPLGENAGKLFGQSVKNNGLGYFTENKNKDVNEIQFRGQINSDTIIYLQYISDGMNPSGETIVHPYFKEYIIAGIHVERLRFGGRGEAWRLNDAKDELQRQFLLTLDYTWSWSAEDVMELLNSGYQLSPKS